jgi:hypothetical protein
LAYNILASENAKVKSWNRITRIIQNIVKIKVHIMYSIVSQYMIWQHPKLRPKRHKKIRDSLLLSGTVEQQLWFMVDIASIVGDLLDFVVKKKHGCK